MKTKSLMFFSDCLAIFILMEFFPSIPILDMVIFQMWVIMIAFFSRYIHWKFTLSLILIGIIRLSYGVWKLGLILNMPPSFYAFHGFVSFILSTLWIVQMYFIARWRIKKKKIYERVGRLQ